MAEGSGELSQLPSVEEGSTAASKDVAAATRVMVVDGDKASLKEMESLMVRCGYDGETFLPLRSRCLYHVIYDTEKDGVSLLILVLFFMQLRRRIIR